MVALIHALIEKGNRDAATQSQTASPLALFNNLRDQDESIRIVLKQYPNGPLMKTIRLFSEDGQMKGFDPLKQQNQPVHLYTFASEKIHISCIRLPCPTSQQFIAKAEIAEEFTGFLRALSAQKRDQRHLLINLQDRTSWHEHARCIAIEKGQKKSKFASALAVVTLPKNTDFYMQSGSYIEWDDAAEFMKQLKEQVASAEQCGFFFPEEIDQAQLLSFVEQAVHLIHAVFFGGKERLVHKNRLDFIEIFYLLLTLKLIEDFRPDTLSLSCKDAVDTGASASAGLYAFLRMMNNSTHWSKEEKDFLLWMLYAPALSVRERAIDVQRFNRMTSALAVVGAELEAHHQDVVAACSKLYQLPFFKELVVKEATSA
nr:hypothetical protein [uncultured bacterium]